MPSVIGHGLIGLGLGVHGTHSSQSTSAKVITVTTACIVSMLPDLDVIAFSMDIPYGAPLGHRGLFHSLAFAVVLGLFGASLLLISGKFKGLKGGALRVLLVFGLIGLSHPLLDMMTNGGLGIAVLAPFDFGRHFFEWQPIPVSPIGLTKRVLPIVYWELAVFGPVALVLMGGRLLVSRLFTAKEAL